MNFQVSLLVKMRLRVLRLLHKIFFDMQEEVTPCHGQDGLSPLRFMPCSFVPRASAYPNNIASRELLWDFLPRANKPSPLDVPSIPLSFFFPLLVILTLPQFSLFLYLSHSFTPPQTLEAAKQRILPPVLGLLALIFQLVSLRYHPQPSFRTKRSAGSHAGNTCSCLPLQLVTWHERSFPKSLIILH